MSEGQFKSFTEFRQNYSNELSMIVTDIERICRSRLISETDNTVKTSIKGFIKELNDSGLIPATISTKNI